MYSVYTDTYLYNMCIVCVSNSACNKNIHSISKNNTKLLEFPSCCIIITDNIMTYLCNTQCFYCFFTYTITI